MLATMPDYRSINLFRLLFSPYAWACVAILGLLAAYLTWQAWKEGSPGYTLLFGLLTVVLLLASTLYFVFILTV